MSRCSWAQANCFGNPTRPLRDRRSKRRVWNGLRATRGRTVGIRIHDACIQRGRDAITRRLHVDVLDASVEAAFVVLETIGFALHSQERWARRPCAHTALGQ